MSSNAFARSRPRVRQQRIPRTPTCDHPRFLLLVNELTRLNDLKRKQLEDHEVHDVWEPLTISHKSIEQPPTTPTCNFNATATSTSNSQKFHHQEQLHYSHHHHHHHHRHQTNQSHDQDLSNNQQYHEEQIGCVKNNISNSSHTAPSSINPFPGYSKPSMVEQNNANIADFSNTIDLRQDENRSKRKRTINDTLSSSCSSATARKGSISGCCSSSSSSKKLKSSPDNINSSARPLSPSFTKCPICLLDSIDRDPSFTNTCFHLFCYVCIENWTKNKATCPLCRTEFTKIIYNIKSATSYEEKIARPIRRDEDEALYPDRLVFEGLSRLPNRHESVVAHHFLPHDYLPFPGPFILNSSLNPGLRENFSRTFETAQTGPGLATVPRQFQANYNPISNYILFSPNRAVQPTSSAMSSASHANSSLSTSSNDPNISNNINSRRSMRNGRYMNRNYEFAQVEATRVTGTVNSNNINNLSSNFDRHHHQHQHQHHQHPQARAIIDNGRRLDSSTNLAYHHHPRMVQNNHMPSHYMPRSRQYNNAQDFETFFFSNYMPDV